LVTPRPGCAQNAPGLFILWLTLGQKYLKLILRAACAPKSQNMNERHYNSHETTEKKTAKDIVRDTVTLRHISENLSKETVEDEINMRCFIGTCYENRDVVADMKQIDGSEKKEYDDVLKDTLRETIFILGKKLNWFGEEARLSQTSKYDQKINGADLAVVYGDEDNPLIVNFDIQRADVKTETRLIGELGQIKYYQSPIDQKNRYTIDSAVSAKVSVAKEDATELIMLINETITLENKECKKDSDEAQIRQLQKDLSSHPLRAKILNEIISQLDGAAKHAEGRDGDKIKKIIFLRDKLIQYEKI
jgi:hypothetical protein